MPTVEQVPAIEPVAAAIGPGHVVVFSVRCPSRSTPNEDATTLVRVGADRGILAVADGVGGQPGGHSASRITLDCLEQGVAGAVPSDPGGSLRSAILDSVERANEELIRLGIGAATTFAALEISGRTVRPYHVGDSAAMVVGQRGKIKLQTVSHSPVGYAIEAGLLDERDALHHDERHLVSNIVGDRSMRIEVGSPLPMAPRDTAIVASDGLWDNLGVDEVADRIRIGPLDDVARGLSETALRRMTSPREGRPSKPDDLSYILFRLA